MVSPHNSEMGRIKGGYSDFAPFIKIDSKWITDLNMKCKSIKLLEDNIGENLDKIGYGNNFLEATSKVRFMKEIIDKFLLCKR